MRHFLIFGRNGNFARSFQEVIHQEQLGTYEQISFAEFLNHKYINELEVERKIVYVYCFGGKYHNRVNIREPDLLTAFLDSLHVKDRFRSTLIFLSTGEVYGNGVKPFTELSPLNPKSQYALDKLKCEKVILDKAPKVLNSTYINRIANAYSCTGWRLQQNLISNLLRSLITQEPFTLTASILSRKQYGTFSDYTQIMIHQVVKLEDNQLAEPTVIRNIAPDFSYSIEEILVLLESTFPKLFQASKSLGFRYRSDQLDVDDRLLESVAPLNFNWVTLGEELSKLAFQELT